MTTGLEKMLEKERSLPEGFESNPSPPFPMSSDDNQPNNLYCQLLSENESEV